MATGLDNFDANLETQIKNDKKAQAKEQLKIIKQFDAMSEQFTKSTTRVQQEKKETAGDVKRREKDSNKKEKTLASKLRMKAKKNK